MHAAQAMNRDPNRGQMPGLTDTSPGDTKLMGVHSAFRDAVSQVRLGIDGKSFL
jgi:hypothetical protein